MSGSNCRVKQQSVGWSFPSYVVNCSNLMILFRKIQDVSSPQPFYQSRKLLERQADSEAKPDKDLDSRLSILSRSQSCVFNRVMKMHSLGP